MANEPKKVLVVDDEPDTRHFVHAALEDDGYHLLDAPNGNVALQKVQDDRPDLIIMDVQMPKKDGLSTLYNLRQDPETKAIPVILLTGMAEKTGVRFSADSVEEYMGERPQAFLNKPVDPEQLRHIVRQLLASPPDLKT